MRRKMEQAVIVSGGNIDIDFALDFLNGLREKVPELYLIAADRGMEFFIRTGIHPDLVVGDFDSLTEEGKRYLDEHPQLNVVRLRPEKDDTDTQSAAGYAAAIGVKRLTLLGATGTRLDHVLANLGLLLWGKASGIQVEIVDSNNFICLAESGKILKKKEQFGKYVSFFPYGGTVEGLTLEGFQYPLLAHCLKPEESGLTVSNEIVEEEAKVSFRTGNLIMIMSRD